MYEVDHVSERCGNHTVWSIEIGGLPIGEPGLGIVVPLYEDRKYIENYNFRNVQESEFGSDKQIRFSDLLNVVNQILFSSANVCRATRCAIRVQANRMGTGFLKTR